MKSGKICLELKVPNPFPLCENLVNKHMDMSSKLYVTLSPPKLAFSVEFFYNLLSLLGQSTHFLTNRVYNGKISIKDKNTNWFSETEKEKCLDNNIKYMLFMDLVPLGEKMFFLQT